MMHINVTDMNRYILIFTALSLWLFCHNAAALTLSATVDRTEINMNESIRLTVTADSQSVGNIDFSALDAQFDILNQQRSTRSQIINGRVSASTQWIFILMPKETGRLLIPSFELKGEFSNAITVQVNNDASTASAGGKDVFLEATLSKPSVYVQEQTILSLKLFYRIGLARYDAPDLTIKDMALELLGDNSYTSQRGQYQYNVLELQYSLNPQVVGDITIPPQRWRLEKRATGFFSQPSAYVFAQSEALKLNVKPIPATSTANNWLPSSAITFEADWSTSPLQATAGEPITLSLTVTANGLTANQISDVSLPDIAGINIYTEPAETENIKSDKGIMGKRTNHFTIIPEKAGEFTLPEIELVWWNTKTDQQITDTLPAQILLAGHNVNISNALPEINVSAPIVEQAQSSSLIYWQIATWVLLSVCLALSGLVIRLVMNKGIISEPEKHLISNPTNEKNALRALKKVINNQEHENLRPALIQWARVFKEDAGIHSLTDIQRAIPELQLSLAQMNNALYGRQRDDSWHPEQLLDVIENLRKEKNQQESSALKAITIS